jgi:DnaJ-class molecular chaperone
MIEINININGRPVLLDIRKSIRWVRCLFTNTCPKCNGTNHVLWHDNGLIGGATYGYCNRCFGDGTFFRKKRKPTLLFKNNPKI